MRFIAELGAAHNGNLEHALALVDAAAEAGATGIKLATWTDNEMESGGHVIESGAWEGQSLNALYSKAYTPRSWHKPIIERAKEKGLTWHSSVFDLKSLEFLEKLGCPAYKISSFELVDIPLIREVGKTRKPIIMSTGMATREEIDDAVMASGWADLTLLHCVSAYPADPADYNLKTMLDLKERYPCDVGLSDHTRVPTVAIASAVMGARMIERHLTLSADGLDDGFASSPVEFLDMAQGVRMALQSIGTVDYGPTPSEMPSVALRRSLWVVKDIPWGGILTPENLQSRRPAGGMPPVCLPMLLGKRALVEIPAGTPMTQDLIGG